MVALSTISNRPAATSLDGTEEIPMQQAGTVVRATVAQVVNTVTTSYGVGVSGGVPYFTSPSTVSSSAQLAANEIVLGGGAATAPATTATGTGVVTALGVNVGSAGAVVVNGGALGTPSSGTLANATGLPISGISGLGSGVATALALGANVLSGFTVQAGGAMFFHTHSFTTAYNVAATDFVVIATSTGAPTYPTAVGVTGQAYIFINATGSPITPATTSGQTINGSSPGAVTAHTAQRVISDGANWQTW